MDVVWLVPIVPGLGAALNGLVGIRFFGKRTAAWVACGAMAVALALSVAAFVALLGRPPEARVHEVVLGPWIPPIPLPTADGLGTFQVPWAVRLDPLAAVMILVVTGVGFLIHVYAVGYMDHEPRGAYARFFSYLNLFCFFMLTLVLASNFLVMFVGWEGVGLCSYLLIGYWYERKSAADAGKKAFIVNRIGDWGFLLGIFLVFFTFGTLDFRAVAAAASAMPVEHAGFGVLSLVCLLLFIGATGKSAQIPLYVWLPDAMEGPTPVSALIHAATMVTAGVYMVARNAVLFGHAPAVMTLVAVVGTLTALMAATIGLVQTDIKRVLAYSTISQLGYMFLAAGVGAFAAGIFHLVTHAFFKALLFLGSGSVIHALAGEQDLRKMGGLRQFLPVTYVTMLVGTLAIAGVPPLSGFFSKDEILYRAFLGNRVLWGLALATAGLTAIYMYRLLALTFYGESRHARGAAAPAAHAPLPPGPPGHGAGHGPHESPPIMTVPLMALAVGALVAGFVGIPPALGGHNAIEHFLEPSFAAPAAAAEPAPAEAPRGAAERGERPGAAEPGTLPATGELGLMLLSVMVAVGGLWGAHRVFVVSPRRAEAIAARWAAVHRLLSRKYYVDELYDATVVRGTLASARGLWTFDRRVIDGVVDGSSWTTRVSAWVSHLVDKYVVDGLVNLVGWLAGESSFVLRRVQTGLIQNYALVMLLGVFALVTLYVFAR